MRLWILEPCEEFKEENRMQDDPRNPWSPWYNKAFGCVVRAETEQQARELVQEWSGETDEGQGREWIDPNFSTCQELTSRGESGIILADVRQP